MDNKSTQQINVLTAWLVGILALFVFGVTYIAFFNMVVNHSNYSGVELVLWPIVACGLVLLTVYKVHSTIIKPVLVRVSNATLPIAFYDPKSFVRPKEELRPADKCGILYIMEREDGILKFGKTKNLHLRLTAHEKDYASAFNIINTWIVPDLDAYEKLFLQMSKQYRFSEEGRLELRQMTKEELSQFILSFTEKAYGGWLQ